MRNLYATLINAESPETIALAPTTAFAISLAAKNVIASGRLGPGKKIIILENEMASNVYPWQNACKETGADLSIVPFPKPGGSWINSILDFLDDSTVVVSTCATHWCDGSSIDLTHLSAELAARYSSEKRPFFIIDGTQSIGAMHFDVTALKPDFVSCSVHKWLLAGRGLSLVYLNPIHHNSWIPLDHHDRTREGSQYSFWDNIGTMRGVSGAADGWIGYPEPFLPGALRIEAGGGHNYVQMAMLKVSLQILTQRWTPERIYPYLSYLIDKLANLITASFPEGPLYVLPKDRRGGNILGIRVDASISWSLTPERIAEELKVKHNIIVAVRLGVVRISPFIFNTYSDMTRVAESLVEVVKTLKVLSRVLITGGNGWLAQHLYKALSSSVSGASNQNVYDVHVTTRGTSLRPSWVPSDRCHEMSISGDDSNIDSVLERVTPDYIVHCAAISAIAACESSPDALEANAPSQLIDAIKRHVPDAVVIFTSTDIVYAGKETSYDALDPECEEMSLNPPLCDYGRSKLIFERLVASSIKNYVILRLSNCLGGVAPFRRSGVKFLEFMENSAETRLPVDLKNDEIRSFVGVVDVVELIQKILQTPMSSSALRSVYNVGGPEGLSRVDIAKLVANARGIPLQIFDANEKEIYSTVKAYNNNTKPWVVHSLSLSEFMERNSSSNSAIRTPRKVVLNSRATEDCFGVYFKDVSEVLTASRRFC